MVPIALSTIPDKPITLLEPEPQRRTGRKFLRWSLGAAGLIVVVGLAWGAVTLARFQDRIYKPLPPTPTVAAIQPTPRAAAAAGTTALPTPTVDRLRDLPPGRFNVLVLGTDKRPDDPDHWPRSDTLLLANVDTVSRTVRIMSIPRDLIVAIPGYGENKVNAAYLFGEYYQEPGGGQALSVQTVSKFFDVPIEYYVAVNFEGFRKVIDTIGGIRVNVPYTLDDYDYPTDDEGDPYGTTHVHFEEGWQQMDGKTALRYARTRHADNDFARSRRQLQIINAVREKALTLDLLPKVPGLIDDLGGMIETNIPFDQQLALAQLGYNLGPSGVITAAIDASMIVPEYLDDGSEGFGLDWDVAGPMLDDFFGLAVAAGESGAGPDAELSAADETSQGSGSSDAGDERDTTGAGGSPPSRGSASPTPRKSR
ncbi:MAG TPA: LCP family protein [Chloroflexia bacterium]|nr:LCP family protein [Chloroflexia bacterium]